VEWSTIASAIAVLKKAKAFLLLSLYSALNRHPLFIKPILSTTAEDEQKGPLDWMIIFFHLPYTK